jgi:hypothetical protein
LSSSLAGQGKAFPARVTSQVMPPDVNNSKMITVTPANYMDRLGNEAKACLNGGNGTFVATSNNGHFYKVEKVDWKGKT